MVPVNKRGPLLFTARTSAVLLLVSSLAMASPDGGTVLDVRQVKAGQAAPWDGVCMSDDAAITTARGMRACEIERQSYRDGEGGVIVAVVLLVSLVAGAALGFAVGRSSR